MEIFNEKFEVLLRREERPGHTASYSRNEWIGTSGSEYNHEMMISLKVDYKLTDKKSILRRVLNIYIF